MADCVLEHDSSLCHSGPCDYSCSIADKICAWDGYDYSNPSTKRIAYLVPGTKAKILQKKFPGVLVELENGSQYWICQWDVRETAG